MTLGIFSHASSAYALRRLQEEAIKKGLKTELINYHDLDFVINSAGVTVFLKDGKAPLPFFDLVILRSAGGLFYYVPQRDFLVSYYQQKGSVVLNQETYLKWSRLDKFTQYLILARRGLPVVDTKLIAQKQRFLADITFPSVVKSYFGSMGKKVFKVEDQQQLEQVLEEYPPNMVLVQELLRRNEDIRVIVLGGQAVGAMKRIAQKGKFLTNYSAGGDVEAFELTEEIKHLAEAAAETFNLQYVGVDLMMGNDGQWRILEVNRSCQFEGFESATGINFAGSVVDYLIKARKQQ